MKIIAAIAALGLLATPVALSPSWAAETGAKADAKAGSNTTMKGDMPGMTMKGDHDSMSGSMSGTMMMSAKTQAKMTDKQKKAKAKAMTDSSASAAAPGGTMMMSGKDKH